MSVYVRVPMGLYVCVCTRKRDAGGGGGRGVPLQLCLHGQKEVDIRSVAFNVLVTLYVCLYVGVCVWLFVGQLLLIFACSDNYFYL